MNLYKLHSDPEELIGDYKVTPLILRIVDSPNDGGESTEYDIIREIVQKRLNGNADIEKAILGLKKKGTLLMNFYSTEVLQSRWKEAEKFIKKNRWDWEDYQGTWGE